MGGGGGGVAAGRGGFARDVTGGGGQEAPNNWVCGPHVIQQFSRPLPRIEGRVSSACVFPTTLGTTRGWPPEAVIGFPITPWHKTYIHIYLYPVIYIPLPNYRWLHNMAVRYLQSVKVSANMWPSGQNLAETGSKWAQFIRLCTPNSPRTLLEKRVLDPFFTHFCSQNGLFSRHFRIFSRPKRVTKG